MKKKRVLFYLLSFLIPICLFLLICLVTGYYPFGNKLLNKYDSYIQYPAMISEFIYKIKHGENLFYTFHAALGSNFFTNFLYYAASPFNLLYLIFNKNQIYLCYLIIILLKLGLSSLTLFYYFNKKYKNNYKINIIFSCVYALSTWSIAFCYQTIWLDALYLAPLLLIGIDKIINENNCKMYMIILILSIFINFYTAYMLGIFSIIYFIYSLFLYKDRSQKKQRIFKFVVATVFCILLTGVILIPTGITILKTRGDLHTNYLGFNYNNIKAFFYNLFPISFIPGDNYNYSSALVGSSLAIVVLNILFYFNKKIEKKEKIITGSVILFFVLSFFIKLLDYGWQMFSQPIWWNSRYAFLFVLFIIIIARKSYEFNDFIKLTKNKKSIIILIAFILFTTSFAMKLKGTQPKDYILYAYGTIFIFFIINLYLLSSQAKFKNYIVFILMIIEILLNGIYCLKVDNNTHFSNYSIRAINQNISILNKLENNNFYRIYDLKDQEQFDYGLLYNYNSTQLFSSVYNKYLNHFYNDYLGHYVFRTKNGINYNMFEYSNIEILSMLNVKYILNSNYDIYGCDKQKTCKNNYVFPLGFILKNQNQPKLQNNQVLSNIEKMYSYFYGEPSNLYSYINVEPQYINIKTKNKKYLSLKNNMKEGYIEYDFISPINGIITRECYREFLNYEISIKKNDNKFVNKQTLKIAKNDHVRLRFTIPKNSHNIEKEEFSIAIINSENLAKIANELNSKQLKIYNDNKNILSGNIYLDSGNQKLFLSIPYDEGLIAYVNNKKVKITKELETFISINLKKGKNNIQLKYIPEGLKEGLIISIFTLIGLITISITLHIQKNYTKNKNKIIDNMQ